MTLFAAIWTFFLGLALLAAAAGILAAMRRTPQLRVAEPRRQVKWQCAICAYVFVEFEEQRFVHCPRCDTLLDAETDATVFTGQSAANP